MFVLLKRLRKAGIHSGWHTLLCVCAFMHQSKAQRKSDYFLLLRNIHLGSTSLPSITTTHPSSALDVTRKHYAESYYLRISYDSSGAYKRRRASRFVSRWLQSGGFVSHPKPNSCMSLDATTCFRNKSLLFCYLCLWGPFETLWRMLTSADKVTGWDLSVGEAESQVVLQHRAWASPVSHTHPLICLNSPGDK